METCQNSLGVGPSDNNDNNDNDSNSLHNNNNDNDSNSMHFSALPSLVRLKIFKMCEPEDLLSLSLCSKWIREELAPLLWNKIDVSWDQLKDFTTLLRKHQCTRNLRFISRLKFRGDSNGELTIQEEQRGYLSFGFGYFLQCCDEERVKFLKIYDFLPADGLLLVCETFQKLHYLEMRFVHDANWDYLSQLPASVRQLTLRSCSIQREHWETICKMDNLKTLEIPWCHWLTSDDFSNVKDFKLTNLIRLELTGTKANDEFIATVCRACSKLRDLQLNDTALTDMGMACIAHMPSLRYLCMAAMSYITDLGIFFISKARLLESLVMTFCDGLSPKCLKYVGTMRSLERLLLSGSCRDATDEDFAHIGNLTSLTALDIPHMEKLTDASLELISTLKNLEHIDMDDCWGFTNDGLVHLTKLPKLENIRMSQETNITTAGLESHGLKDLLDPNVIRTSEIEL